MNTNAEYLIAQYFREPMRHEGRNIGIFVFKNDRTAAKFIGESEAGVMAPKRIRSFLQNPNIYRQWVESWREEMLEKSNVPLRKRLLSGVGGNYQVIPGGVVANTGSDSVDEICRYLFSTLVETKSALTVEEELEAPTQQFKTEITGEFRKLNLMIGTKGENIKYPIYEGTTVEGKYASHSLSYTQRNGKLWVMEPVNFAQQDKKRAKDHAGWTAKVFDDIKLKHGKRAETIAIVHGAEDDLIDQSVKSTLPLLESSARLVFWNRPKEREEFLAERLEVGLSS